MAPGLVALLIVVAVSAGCTSQPVLDETAVAEPAGRVLDLSLLGLPDGSMALGWRDSAEPNDAHARASFLMLGANGRPRGALHRDDNESEASSGLVATQRSILRVLAERGDAGWGLVVVARDIETGELLTDGYRTLPVFAGATLTDLQLVPTATGAVLAWIERSGGEIPSDFVQLVALDEVGQTLGPPQSLTQLPAEVVAIDLQPWADGQQAVLAVLARRAASAQVWIFPFEIDSALHLREARQLAPDVSNRDRVLDLLPLDGCLELLVTEGGTPARASIDLGSLGSVTFERLPANELPAVAPRLLPSGDASILYVGDRPDGTTRFRTIEHIDRTGDACATHVGGERPFPLSSERCQALSTLPGSPLPYACAAACLTKGCGDTWIWVGRADLGL